MADQKPADDTKPEGEEIPEGGDGSEGGGTPPEKKLGEGEEPKLKPEDIDDPVIPLRKSVTGHIIQRQKKTIEKLRGKLPEGEEEEEEDLSPEAKTAVSEEVKKQITPVMDSLAEKADEDELQDLLKAEPEAKKFEKRIRAYMKHPAYKQVPPKSIYHDLAFEMSANPKKKKVADAEADEAKGAGSGIKSKPGESNAPTEEEVEAMDDKAIEDLGNKVRQGKA